MLMAGGRDWEEVVQAARDADPGDRIVVNMGPAPVHPRGAAADPGDRR
ncbi:NADH-quinone oxidoreductase subunit D domain protein [Mycobacterium xenopi 3993]|nr:NADH-quinone oxidoreductase subunit D domain protein [Mycobacterium xenopi 3993]